MARAKKTAVSTGASVARSLIASIGLPSMKTIIEKLWPEANVKQTNNAGLVMRCPMPWHPESTGSFHWDFTDGHVFCYGCKYYAHDLFSILKDSKGMTPKEATDVVRAHAPVRVLSEQVVKDLDARAAHREATRVLMAAFNRFLCRCITPPPGDPDYSPALARAVAPTLEWLFSARRHLADQAPYMPYGVVPPQEMLAKLVAEIMDEDVVERAANKQSYPDREWRDRVHERIKFLADKVDVSYCYQVTFHTGYSLTEPGRIRVRRASNEKGIIVLPGFDENSPNGFFGLYSPAYLAYTAKDTVRLRLVVVEGENDCLTSAERYREAGLSGVLFVACCGSSVVIDELADAGFDSAYIVADNPAPNFGNGVEIIKACLMTSTKVRPHVFVGWDDIRREHPTVKDPDDAVAAIGFRPFFDMVADPASSSRYYQTAKDWALEQVDVERQAKHIDEVQRLNELAAAYGQYVRNPAAQAAFIDEACKRLDLSTGPLRQAIVQRKDTAETFRLRITQQLRSECHPLYKVTTSRHHMMHLWHRQSRVEIVFPMHDGEAIANSLAGIHGNIYTWMRDTIVIPPFMSGGDDEGGGDGLRAVEPEIFYIKKLYDYLKLAAQDLFMGLPEKKDCEHYGQGQHRLPDPTREGTHAYYVVNGRHVYKGTFAHENAQHVDWVELDGPADGRYVFRLEHKPWSEEISDVNDLVAGNNVTKDQLRWAIGLVETALECWQFDRQDTDPVFLAHHLFVVATPIAFDAKVIVSILGDTSSGKSTLLSVFAGGKARSLRLLENSRLAENYTAASIYQEWDGMALSMCLDEFEDAGNNDSKSRAVAEIQTFLRTIINDSAAQINRGSANAEDGVRKYRFSAFVMFASILKARQAQDENRRFDVDLRKNDALDKPQIAVFQRVSRDDYAKARRILSIAMYRYAEQIRRASQEIEQEVNTTKFFSHDVPSRTVDCLIPAAAIMALVDSDWRAFMRKTCERMHQSGKFAAQAKDTASSNMFDRLIRTPGIRLGGSNGRAEARFIDLMGSDNDDEIGLLNNSGCGMYFMKDANLVVVNWITVQAKGGIMDKWPEYNRISHRNLKHMFDQNPEAVRNEDIERLGINKFVQSQGDIWRPDLFSAYDVTSLMKQIRVKDQNQPTAPSMPKDSTTTVPEFKKHGSGNLD
jgi:hypothetical protein